MIKVKVDKKAAEAYNEKEWRSFFERLEAARLNPPPGAAEAGFVFVPGPLLMPTRDFCLVSLKDLDQEE